MALGSRIKGITIEFDGDTTKLGQALRQVDQQSKGVNQSLREVNRALKFNPNNTELLAQKQTLLKSKIEETKRRLDALRQAQARMDDDPAIEKESQEYQALRREIIQTESKVKNLETESKKLGDVKLTALGNQMESVGKKMSSVGDNMTRTVTTPLVGLGGIAAKIGMDFDAQMSKVGAIAGATGDDFTKLRDKARQMGSATKFTATEAGQGFEYMAMAGWKTGDMLEGIEPILNLATASGEDLGTTSDIVTDALTAFGLKAKDAGMFSDVLAQASSNANTNVSMMGETFKYAAPVAGSLGYSVQDTALAIGLMANSGIKASSAGTSLRSIMSRMASPTKASEGAMAKLGLELTKSDGSMKSFREVMIEARTAMQGMTETEKTQIAADLAGKNAMSGFLAIVNASDEDFNNLASSIDNSAGATDRMSQAMMDNTKGGVTTMISALQNAAITISDVLAPWITKVAKFVEELANKFSALPESTQKMILMAAGIAAAMGPVLSIIGRMATGIGAIIKVVGKLKTGIGLLSKTFTLFSGPVGIAIAAIAAAIAIGVLLYKNWDKIRAKAGQLKEWVVTKFNQLKEGIGKVFESLKNAGSRFVDIITWPFRKAWDFIKTIASKIKNAFTFKFKLPKIKLPHFAIQPKGWKLGDLLEGSIPSLGIDWYANGGIFNKPTVAGVGDVRGGEAAVPLTDFYNRLDAMADSIVNGVAMALQMQAASANGDVKVINYLYPSGPKMGEVTVKTYDQYKPILG